MNKLYNLYMFMIIKGKMFLAVWYVFTHGEPPSTAVRRAGRVQR